MIFVALIVLSSCRIHYTQKKTYYDPKPLEPMGIYYDENGEQLEDEFDIFDENGFKKKLKKVGKKAARAAKKAGKSAKKATKATYKATKTSLKATGHVAKGLTKVAIQPHKAKKILKDTRRSLRKDLKQFRKDIRPFTKTFKKALKVMKQIAPYIGPVISIIPGVGQVYLIAQVATTIATAYKAYAIYNAAKACYLGVKNHDLRGALGGVVSACGQLNIPGADKMAQVYTQGTMAYGAIKNKDYKMLAQGAVAAIGGEKVIKNYATNIVGNNELLVQGVKYYEQGREIYKDTRNIYKAARHGDLTGALLGSSTLIDKYSPDGSIKSMSELTKNSAIAADLIKNKKFGEAIESISGTADSVFKTNFTSNLHNEAHHLNEIARDIKSGNVGTAYQKIAEVYDIELPESVVDTISTTNKVKNDAMSIYNDLRDGKVGTAYQKFTDSFGVSLPKSTVDQVQKLVEKEKNIEKVVRNGEKAVQYVKKGDYEEAYELFKPFINIGENNEKVIEDLFNTKKELFDISELVKERKLGEAYEMLVDKFDVSLSDSLVKKIEQSYILKQHVESTYEESLEIAKLIKENKINQAYMKFTNLTGVELQKPQKTKIKEIAKYYRGMNEIKSMLKSKKYDQAFNKFTTLTGINVIKSVEEKIASATFIISKMANIHDLIQDKKYKKAYNSFVSFTKITLDGESEEIIEKLENYYKSSLDIKGLIDKKNYEEAIKMVKSEFDIDLGSNEETVKFINQFYRNVSNSYRLSRAGFETKAYDLIKKTAGLTLEAADSDKVACMNKFVKDAKSLKSAVEAGDLQKALRIKNMPKGMMSLLETTKENFDQFKEIVEENSNIIANFYAERFDLVLDLPQENSVDSYVRPERFEENEFLEEENVDELYQELSLNDDSSEIDDDVDDPEATEQAEKVCQGLLGDLDRTQMLLSSSIGKRIAEQTTDFIMTLEDGSEQDLDDNKMVHKAINKQSDQFKELGDSIDESAPIVKSVEQLLKILENIQ